MIPCALLCERSCEYSVHVYICACIACLFDFTSHQFSSVLTAVSSIRASLLSSLLSSLLCSVSFIGLSAHRSSHTLHITGLSSTSNFKQEVTIQRHYIGSSQIWTEFLFVFSYYLPNPRCNNCICAPTVHHLWRRWVTPSISGADIHLQAIAAVSMLSESVDLARLITSRDLISVDSTKGHMAGILPHIACQEYVR